MLIVLAGHGFSESNNSAWEIGQDFWGNPASQAAQRGPFYGIETSIPGYQEQYFAAVSQDEELGIGFQYLNDPLTKKHQTLYSLAWSEQIIPQITIGLKGNYLNGSLSNRSNIFWDWGVRWRPLHFVSLGLDQKAFSSWKGQAPKKTHYGIQIQIWKDYLQGGVSWNRSGLEFPFWRNKSQSSFDLDSAELNLSTNLSYFELGISAPMTDIKGGNTLAYQLKIKSPQTFTGWSTKKSNGAQTLSFGFSDYQDPHIQDYANKAILKFNFPITDSPNVFSLLGSGSSVTIDQVLAQLKEVEEHPLINEVYLKFNGMTANWANLREIRKALIKIQKSGKEVNAFLVDGQFKSYYLASMANKVILHPASYLKILGFSSEVTLYKGFFDTLGVQAQFIRHGKFKSAVEPYTRKTLSEEARADISSIQQGLWKTLSKDIRISRRIDSLTFEKYVNQVHLTQSSALERNLIDTVMYFDELFDDVRFGMSHAIDFYVPPVKNPTFYNTEYIAVVYAEGSIIQGSSGANNLNGAKHIGHSTIERQLAHLAQDDQVKGVILRVNSPGGSAWASDAMHHAVENFKESGKPIVTSVGGVAASGGYYLICGTQYIFTEKTSILGSIGIYGGKFVLDGLKKKFGINTEIVKSHQSADSEGSSRLWTDQEVNEIQIRLDEFYGDFVKKVAAGRGLDSITVDSLGQGRVFTGDQALLHGLADEEGGLNEAINYMKKQIRINSNSTLRVINYTANDKNWLNNNIPFFLSTSKIESQRQLYIDLSTTLLNSHYWAFSPWLSGVN